MIYRVRHRTRFRYEAPVRVAQCNLRLKPVDYAGQTLEDFALAISPHAAIEDLGAASYPVHRARMLVDEPADELVIHGWDLARATGQEYAPDEGALRMAHGFLAAAEDKERGEGIFGPVVPVREDAPLLDRALGLSGRDPSWRRP